MFDSPLLLLVRKCKIECNQVEYMEGPTAGPGFFSDHTTDASVPSLLAAMHVQLWSCNGHILCIEFGVHAWGTYLICDRGMKCPTSYVMACFAEELRAAMHRFFHIGRDTFFGR